MKSKTILVIDDDESIVKLIQVLLERHGFDVVTAYDGNSGLQKIVFADPALIILDIDMPEMNGFDVLERLKAKSITKQIPVIMLTARTMGDDFDLAMKKHADWYIAKPFSNDHLLEKVKYLISKSGSD